MAIEWSGLSPGLLVRLDRSASQPMRIQLEASLREAIRGGRLRAGERLPSTRQLAQALGVSRGMVQECYGQLLAEGYLTSRTGSATRVADISGQQTGDQPVADVDMDSLSPARQPPVRAGAGYSRQEGGQPCRGLTRAGNAARSTPANPPRKGSSRSSTRSPRSVKPARPTFAASSTRGGFWAGTDMKTAGSRVAILSGPLCNTCSRYPGRPHRHRGRLQGRPAHPIAC